ncbi:hypothetical protein QTP86_028246, partial [Hemibagrus guttatus]
KGRELADVMERRKVDILCVQETRWKGSKACSIGAGFKLFYYGVDSKRNGVGVVLKEEFVRNVLEVKRVSDRVMSLKLEIEGVMLNVVSGYAPQVGCELEEKERFWSELDEVMESIPTGERVVIGADFNGHVGEGNTGDEEVMGKFGVKERNLEGQMVVDFAKRMDMGVVNTYFQKREEHRVTYKSGGRSTQVDYILCRRGNLKEISDCKVVVGESVARQHRMVVCRMTLMVCKTKRSKIEKKTKWWKLKKEECCEEFRQKLRQALGGQVVLPDDWETTAEVIRETGRKVLGVSSGRRKEDKETWWWNEEVQDSIQRKRLAKKKWDMDRTEENRQEYKELQCRVKREVSKAKQKAYEELYTRLDTREGEKDLYRLARQRDRDGKDVQQVRVIKDRDGRVLTSEESVQRRWKEYFEELMNEENEREKRVEGVNSVEQEVDKIRKDEVRKALKRMKSGKAVGPDDIPVEVWKCLGEAAVEFLANLFNRVLESERMPEEWRRSVLVPIFKNKGDVQSCSNYRGIKLMSHTMKVWERVVEARLRKVVDICEQQYGFMPRKSTTDAIFALRILMEKYRDGQKELHCVFVDLEKAYDRVPREELWYCMRKSGVAEKYVRVVQDMYERSRTVVRCAVGQTEEFNVEVGLHQGSALSPFLFAIVMDQLSEEVRQESPWTMMFADDIVICSESREQVEENLERWRFALERRGMKVSRSKTEYMCVNEREGSGTVRLQGEEVKKVQEFKYLGSTVQSNGECGKEVKKRVQAGWNGWRKVSGVLCDQKISARIKGKVYRTVVRPAMLYGLETVSLRKRQESELEIKKQQEAIFQFLDSKNIKYFAKDITQDPQVKAEMREKAGNPKALPPQVFNGSQYCGVQSVAQTAMDSYNIEDNRMMESEQSVQVSNHGDRKDSALSGYGNRKLREDNESSRGNRARTRIRDRKRDPDKDQMSDGDQSSASFYSDDYENASLSDRSISPRSPSPSLHRGARTQRVSNSLVHQTGTTMCIYTHTHTEASRGGEAQASLSHGKRVPKPGVVGAAQRFLGTGVRKSVPRRPGPQTLPSQRSSGLRSQSLGKDAPPKDLDLVTKRLLSARLLKISELKNALAELQLRTDELQRENRLLKQLQLRHEKALHRYSDTESEISQLISRHNNETHVLRERLRRSQEKERMAERRCAEADAQLQRCRDQLHKLRQLADDQHLGERDELARKLAHTQVKVQESERRVKELEKNMELSTGSFQRQLASERKKTHDAQQESRTLQEEISKLSAKLKERERELDARNIYANRMLRGASKKDLEDSIRRKGGSRSSSKAVQTEDRMLSLDFPSPPLAITNGSEFSCDDQADDYLSLKASNSTLTVAQELQSSEQRQTGAEAQRIQETAREQEVVIARGMALEEQGREKDRIRERERKSENENGEKGQKQSANFEMDLIEEKGMRQRDGRDRDEEDRKRRSEWQTEEEKSKEPHLSEQEIQANQERAEEERRRKDRLFAKMREIDMQAQAQDSSLFQDKTERARTPPQEHAEEERRRKDQLLARMCEIYVEGQAQDFSLFQDKKERARTPPRNQNTSIFNFTEPREYLSTSNTGKRGTALRSQKTNQDLDLTFGSYAPSFGKPTPRAGLGHRSPSQTVDQLSGDENGGMDLSGLAKEKKSDLLQQLFGSSVLSAPHVSPSKMELLNSPSTISSSRRGRDTETLNKLKKTTLHVSESGPAVRAITTLDDDIEEVTL